LNGKNNTKLILYHHRPTFVSLEPQERPAPYLKTFPHANFRISLVKGKLFECLRLYDFDHVVHGVVRHSCLSIDRRPIIAGNADDSVAVSAASPIVMLTLHSIRSGGTKALRPSQKPINFEPSAAASTTNNNTQ
jgi:hypothetical protein